MSSVGISIAALGVSVLALVSTWYVYVKHDRILKKYQAKKFEEEERNKKAALIRVEKLMEPNFKGGNNIYLLVSNKGLAKANNLRVWTEPKALVSDYYVDHFNPEQEERRVVILSFSSGDSFEAFYTWDDGLGAHKDSVIISFG